MTVQPMMFLDRTGNAGSRCGGTMRTNCVRSRRCRSTPVSRRCWNCGRSALWWPSPSRWRTTCASGSGRIGDPGRRLIKDLNEMSQHALDLELAAATTRRRRSAWLRRPPGAFADNSGGPDSEGACWPPRRCPGTRSSVSCWPRTRGRASHSAHIRHTGFTNVGAVTWGSPSHHSSPEPSKDSHVCLRLHRRRPRCHRSHGLRAVLPAPSPP